MMLRIALVAIMVASITGVVALTGILPTSAQSAPTPSATRSFDSTSVAPEGQVVVTIAAANYGQAGGVTETLPTGFAYVSSSLAASQVTELSGNRVRFTLQGDASFTYTVTASITPGPYDFSGTLRTSNGTTTPWAAPPASRWMLPALRLPAPRGALIRHPWPLRAKWW